jgi:glucuronosyltransferase
VHPSLKFPTQMSFLQRCANTLISLCDVVMRKYYYLPRQDEMVRKHFKNLPKPVPSVAVLEKSISVSIVNAHRGLSLPRPAMPGQINVGGAHIKKPKPLPKDLQEYLDGATDGAILFSLGSYLNSSDMPAERMQMFVNAFGNLTQRVIWKFEDESLTDLPYNLKIMKWLPQSDILAHPNVKLFITHGGLFGTLESIHRGVPMLFIPFYGDQVRIFNGMVHPQLCNHFFSVLQQVNALKATKKGFGEHMNFVKITQQSLINSIRGILENRKYSVAIQAQSKIFRDNPIEPLDEAIYWIEYVIKHKGAPHLKSHTVNMPWYVYNLLDVFGFFFICVAVACWSWYLLIKRIKSMFCKKSVVDKNKKD